MRLILLTLYLSGDSLCNHKAALKNIGKCISWIRHNWPYKNNKNIGIKTVSIHCVTHWNYVIYKRSTDCKNKNRYKPGVPYAKKCKSSTYYSSSFPESVQSIHHSLQIYLMTNTMLQLRRKGEPSSMRFNVIVNNTPQHIYWNRIHQLTLWVYFHNSAVMCCCKDKELHPWFYVDYVNYNVIQQKCDLLHIWDNKIFQWKVGVLDLVNHKLVFRSQIHMIKTASAV